MQLLRPLKHPLGENRRTLRNLALRHAPVLDPACAFFPHKRVRKTVRRIPERFFERNKAVAALAKNVHQFADVIGFQVAGVKQQNLLRFITGYFCESCSKKANRASW